MPVDFSCTLVQGLADAAYYPNVVKSVSVAAGAGGTLVWSATDNGDLNLTAPAISCNLPPQTELNYTNINFLEEIGS